MTITASLTAQVSALIPLLSLVLILAGATLLVHSGAVLGDLRVAQRMALVIDVLRAAMPPYLLLDILAARCSGRSDRALVKRYRSLRRRAVERCVEQFFDPEGQQAASPRQVVLALLIAVAGCVVFLLAGTPAQEIITARS
jgi:hypothetical protein